MARHANSFDFILDTVSARHDMDGLLALLKRDATLTLVGAPPDPPTVTPFSIIFRRRQYAGSLIGGIPETQEMLDFCAQRRLTADVEIIPIQDIEKAYARMLKGDVKYRFVIDMASLPA
jgi:alcohol dehydrogenase (NADP+)